MFCYLCGPVRRVCLLLFVCKCRCPIAPSAASTSNKDKSENRVTEEEEETKGLHDERRGFYSKGKYIFLDCILETSDIFYIVVSTFFKKRYSLIKIISTFMQLTSLCATFQRNHRLYEIIILTLILLTRRILWAPNNARKWQKGFNSVFKGVKIKFDNNYAQTRIQDYGALCLKCSLFCKDTLH